MSGGSPTGGGPRHLSHNGVTRKRTQLNNTHSLPNAIMKSLFRSRPHGMAAAPAADPRKRDPKTRAAQPRAMPGVVPRSRPGKHRKPLV